MKLSREKYIRSMFIANTLDLIVHQIARGITAEDCFFSSRAYFKNICTDTGRSRGVVKKFHISRMVFRNLADTGKIEGVRRASW